MRRGSRIAGGFALALLLAACGGADGPAATTEATFDTLFTIGEATGEPWQAFGGIWDVAAAPDGRFAVLDVERVGIHFFGPDGAHLGSVTQVGADPGQIRRPRSLAWTGAGELLVWDPGNSFLSRFAVGPTGVSFVDRQRAFAFGETGFCVSGSRIYLSYFMGEVVHEVGPDGGTVRSFGPAPTVAGLETLNPDLQEIALEELAASRLLCLPDGVLSASFFEPRVALHDLEGNERWSRDLADFRPVVAYTPDDIGLGLQYSPEGSHLLRSVVPWGDGTALLQYELRDQAVPPPGTPEVFESRILRLSDGVEVERTRSLPLLLGAQGSRAYTVRQEPYPQVIVLERAGS